MIKLTKKLTTVATLNVYIDFSQWARQPQAGSYINLIYCLSSYSVQERHFSGDPRDWQAGGRGIHQGCEDHLP